MLLTESPQKIFHSPSGDVDPTAIEAKARTDRNFKAMVAVLIETNQRYDAGDTDKCADEYFNILCWGFSVYLTQLNLKRLVETAHVSAICIKIVFPGANHAKYLGRELLCRSTN